MPAQITDGTPTIQPALTPDGLPEQVSTVLDDEVLTVFAPRPIEADTTVVDLYEAGGAILSQQVANAGAANDVVGRVGDYAAINRVGPFDAALVHSSELAKGLRVWSVFWSDGRVDYAVTANMPPEEVLAVARSMYCP
jgi:hypothetical protein